MRRLLPCLLVVLALVGTSGAQIPPPGAARSMPLPGPAPSEVVRHPPLHGIGPTGGMTSPSSWDALREAEEELRRREEDLSRCRARLDAATEDLAATQEYLARLDEARSRLRDEVLRRMVLLDRVSRGGIARLILTSRDPGEVRFRSRLLTRLIRDDAALAARYSSLGEEARTVRAGLAGKIETQRALAERLEERRRQLEAEVRGHDALVSTLDTPAAAAGLEAAARLEVDGLAEALGITARTADDPDAARRLAQAAVAVPASFPVADDSLGRGVAVDVPSGLPVAAPAEGRVAFAGILSGYGLSVLIRTAAGDAVLLGHLANLAVATGDPLAAGTIVGDTAPSYSPLLPPLIVDSLGDGVRVL